MCERALRPQRGAPSTIPTGSQTGPVARIQIGIVLAVHVLMTFRYRQHTRTHTCACVTPCCATTCDSTRRLCHTTLHTIPRYAAPCHTANATRAHTPVVGLLSDPKFWQRGFGCPAPRRLRCADRQAGAALESHSAHHHRVACVHAPCCASIRAPTCVSLCASIRARAIL